MIERAGELEAAASEIDKESLDAARSATIAGCKELMHWLEQFSNRLETLGPSEQHKFARALALTLLGHLPTRPESCPFCIQYDRSRSCRGCGYARTHGRCDSDQSSFSIFIESFSQLGRAIYQDMEEPGCQTDEARVFLDICIRSSSRLAWKMKEDLPSLSVRELMERKSMYLGRMIQTLPVELFGWEVKERQSSVLRALIDYW